MDDYSILEHHHETGDIYIEEVEAPKPFTHRYAEGVPLPRPKRPPRLIYKHKTARRTDYPSGVMPFPVVSQRFRKLLDEFGDPLEFHPVQVVYAGDAESEDGDPYSMLNILRNVEALDREKSGVVTVPGTAIVVRVKRLVVRADALAGRHIVRLAEMPSLILTSARLRAAVTERKLTGTRFTRIEDFEQIRAQTL
jgi:uncharacterized protein DUF1629